MMRPSDNVMGLTVAVALLVAMAGCADDKVGNLQTKEEA